MATEPSLVDQMLAADIGRVPWRPLIDEYDPSSPTPQHQAYDSQADILGYGGAAGGGKTDLLIGLARTAHYRSVIFRREYGDTTAIRDRVIAMVKTRDGYSSQPHHTFKLPGRRMLTLRGMQNLGDEQRYQGQPFDLMAFDELAQFLEIQFRFVITWNRPGPGAPFGQRCRVVGAFNPPTTSEGDWIIPFWGPWLDDQHPNPAEFGALRWFAMVDGHDREVETNAPFEHKRELIQPRSRTFIPSKVEDNPYLMAQGYRATLQALPEPLRSQMLKGDFLAGREDDPWQVIPTAWVEMAFERWRNRSKPRTPMTQMGVDVARGGAAKTVLAPRHDNYVDELKIYPGKETPDGPASASLVVAHLKGGANAAIDVCGPGGEVYGHLNSLGVPVSRCDGAEPSHGRDKSGSLPFFNKRSEWWWRLREDLDPANGQEVALPPSPSLRADLCAVRWSRVPRGIKVELKEEVVKRIGRSPDEGDAVVYSFSDELVTNRPLTHVIAPMVEREYNIGAW